MPLHLIYAKASNGVIGNNGSLPWNLPQDMAHFKRMTHGCTVIMGRKTWDSLPERFRPLPGRTNVVVSRQAGWNAAGATHARSLKDALEHIPKGQVGWVIGGAQIYAEALPYADRIEVTEIDHPFEGDAFAPVLGAEWMEVAREVHSTDEFSFRFVSYVKNN